MVAFALTFYVLGATFVEGLRELPHMASDWGHGIQALPSSDQAGRHGLRRFSVRSGCGFDWYASLVAPVLHSAMERLALPRPGFTCGSCFNRVPNSYTVSV